MNDVTLGKRTRTALTGEEENVDRAFWGSEQHRTWEESESDSDISYDLDEDEEEESESDSELDEEEKEESSEDDESEDEDTRKKQKKGRFQAYKPVSVSEAGAPKKKTIVRRKPKPVVLAEESIAPDLRRETRDSTRARTMEVQDRPTPVSTRRIRRPTDGRKIYTQEQLMEEARIVEEWNKADLDAYIKYTEMSEKEKNAMMQKRRRGTSQNEFTIFSRSYIDSRGEVSSELRLVPPPQEESLKKKIVSPLPLKSTQQLLGIAEPEEPAMRSGFAYRYPYGGLEGFNTVEQYEAIRADYVDYEIREIKNVISKIHSLQENIK